MTARAYWDSEADLTSIDAGETSCVMVSMVTRRGRRFLKLQVFRSERYGTQRGTTHWLPTRQGMVLPAASIPELEDALGMARQHSLVARQRDRAASVVESAS
jgi:hypothetical protein